MWMDKKSYVLPLLFIFAIVVYCGWPLLGSRFIPTHDGEYHIVRFAQFYSMLSSGYPFPRWAPDMNSGYGIPLFNFHYPLPNYVGSLFHVLGSSFVDSVKRTLFVGYAGATFFCFLWLSKIWGKKAATVGTIVFCFIPYWFVDIYVRGSVGEVLAICFAMLALASIEYSLPVVFTFSIAAIVISHNILAMLFLPILVIYAFLRNRQLIPFMLLGIGITACFWLPALAEQRFVVGLNTVRFQDHFPDVTQLLFPSWGTGFSGPGMATDEMSQQIGIVPLLCVIGAAWFALKEKIGNQKRLVWYFIVSYVLVVFLMNEASLPIWQFILPLQYLQYPWRLLSVLLPLSAFFGAYLSYKIKNTVFAVLVVILAIVMNISYSRPVTYEPRTDAHYLMDRDFTDGTSSLGNSFSTIWAPWKRQRANRKIEIIGENTNLLVRRMRLMQYSAYIDAKGESTIRFNIAYYPGWRLRIDNKSYPFVLKDGVMETVVPNGTHLIDMTFTDTPLRFTANLISLGCLFWLSIWAILKNRNEHSYRHNTT